MGIEDFCNTGLGLGLGCQRTLEIPMKSDHQQQKNMSLKFDHLFPPSSTSEEAMGMTRSYEPSLTLGLSDDMYQSSTKIDINKAYEESSDLYRQSSPHSAISSFSNASIKREKDFATEEVDVELERVSSRVSDEDEEGNARKKLRLTKEQSALLEDSFKEHSTLNPKQKQALAKQLNLRPRQVEVWFQNRRARFPRQHDIGLYTNLTKLKQTEVECEFLKKCCETLTDENRRLQKELQKLKALKLSPPLYMQLPAATLTMCPSCERIGGSGIGDSSSKSPFTMAPKPHFCNPLSHPSSAW